jgi:hypothetical protein
MSWQTRLPRLKRKLASARFVSGAVMANGRNKLTKRIDASRVPGGFAALPWSVLDSPAFLGLSHPAKALLLELCRQYVSGRNGTLLLSIRYLRERGWKSADVINRAKTELLASGLIFETYKGHRPNKASWYALTWYSLEPNARFDPGAIETFSRGSYLSRSGDSLLETRASRKLSSPSPGLGGACIAPSNGSMPGFASPSAGSIRAFPASSLVRQTDTI